MSIFSDRLKQLRREQKINQSELARVINKSRPTIAAYETDGRMPDIETLAAIANYFNVNVDWLLGRTDDRNKIYKNPNPHSLSEDAFRIFVEMGLAKSAYNNDGLVINIDIADLEKMLNDVELQIDFIDRCLEKTLKLFALPLEAKADLNKALLSLFKKYGKIDPYDLEPKDEK